MSMQTAEQDAMDVVFRRIARVIYQETHNDTSLVRMVADMIAVNPIYAQGFARHCADILEDTESAVDYCVVIAAAFHRSLFDLELCKKYDTDCFCGSVTAAQEFAISLEATACAPHDSPILIHAATYLH